MTRGVGEREGWWNEIGWDARSTGGTSNVARLRVPYYSAQSERVINRRGRICLITGGEAEFEWAPGLLPFARCVARHPAFSHPADTSAKYNHSTLDFRAFWYLPSFIPCWKMGKLDRSSNYSVRSVWIAWTLRILSFLRDLGNWRGADQCKKIGKIDYFSFSQFLKDLRFKNTLPKFCEEIRKIHGDIVFSAKRCQARDWTERNFERVFLTIKYIFQPRWQSTEENYRYIQLTWTRAFIVRKTRRHYMTISFFN